MTDGDDGVDRLTPTQVDPRLRARAEAILAPLDEAQRAASLVVGPAIVVGSAGTGKTRVLAHRLAYLCAGLQVPPRRILALTRTERDAEELRARAQRLMVFPLHGAWLGTFHEVCQRILRAHAATLGRKASFVIVGEADARTLIRRAARVAGADPDRHPPARLQELIAAHKRSRTSPEGTVGDVYRAYEAALAEANAFDSDDLLRHVIGLLEHDPMLRAKYRRRFEHILVDHFEDTTPPQRELLRWLGAPLGAGPVATPPAPTTPNGARHVLVVSDPDQALTPVGVAAPPPRPARVEDFLGDFPGARRLDLAHDHRSTKRIHRAAARLIVHTPGPRVTADAVTRRGRALVSAACADEITEAALVVRWVARIARVANVAPARTAILVRQPIMARPFEEALVRAGLPYRVVGGLRFYERREIKDVLAYLRLTLGGGDPAALARIANVPRRGIGPASVATLASMRKRSKITMAEAALRAASLPRVTAQRAGALADLGRMLQDLDEAARRLPCAELIDFVVERSGYGRLLGELSRAEEETRREGIDELRGLARAFAGPAAEALPRLFAQVALVSGAPWIAEPVWPALHPPWEGDENDEGDEDGDADAYEPPTPGRSSVAPGDDRCVQLATYAEAKGRDFDVVFLTGMEEGVLPHERALRYGDAGIEADRRLCYVAMTRARARVVFTHALSRTLLGRTRAGAPSRFLAETGRRVKRLRPPPSEPLKPSKPVNKIAPPIATAAPHMVNVVKAGQRVVHDRYGVGLVLSVEGDVGFVVVEFENPEIGEKRLSLAHARLSLA
jgi:DNA helicase-2/ATP-dependent DNA helicase PcrA